MTFELILETDPKLYTARLRLLDEQGVPVGTNQVRPPQIIQPTDQIQLPAYKAR